MGKALAVQMARLGIIGTPIDSDKKPSLKDLERDYDALEDYFKSCRYVERSCRSCNDSRIPSRKVSYSKEMTRADVYLGLFCKELKCPLLEVLLASHPDILESLICEVQSQTTNNLYERDRSGIWLIDRNYYNQAIHVLGLVIGLNLYLKR